jgi:hypothetical protein
MSADVHAHLLFISTRTGRCQNLRGIQAQPSDYAAVVWHHLTKSVITFITCEGKVIAADARRAAVLGETLYKQEIAEAVARLASVRREQPRARHKRGRVRWAGGVWC